MIIRVTVTQNNTSSYKLSVNKKDATDLGLKKGERWEIEMRRPITKEVLIAERKRKFEDIPKEEDL